MSIYTADPAIKLRLLSSMFVVELTTPATIASVSSTTMPMILVMVISWLSRAVCCIAALRLWQFLLLHYFKVKILMRQSTEVETPCH